MSKHLPLPEGARAVATTPPPPVRISLAVAAGEAAAAAAPSQDVAAFHDVPLSGVEPKAMPPAPCGDRLAARRSTAPPALAWQRSDGWAAAAALGRKLSRLASPRAAAAKSQQQQQQHQQPAAYYIPARQTEAAAAVQVEQAAASSEREPPPPGAPAQQQLTAAEEAGVVVEPVLERSSVGVHAPQEGGELHAPSRHRGGVAA